MAAVRRSLGASALTTLTQRLRPVTAARRAAILAAPRTAAAHRALMAQVAAMTMLETGGSGSAHALPPDLTVVAWNMERCLFPDDSAAHLARHQPQVILLSEMDNGMARTAQRHTTADMARALGMGYAYGVEFHEIGLGNMTERRWCQDGFNAAGWHGNAILSAAPFERLHLIRLDDHGHWFVPDGGKVDPAQPRLGGRMAVAAVIRVGDAPVCFVSVHLESNAGAVHRHSQFERLLDALDDFAPGLPVVIGGDLNTGNTLPDGDWQHETLFAHATDRGYAWGATPEGVTTRPSLISRHKNRLMKLDWFCTRGMAVESRQVLASLDDTGRPLSDHDAILARLRVA